MHNFNLVYITLFFAFSIALVSGLLGAYNIGRLEAKLEYTHRLFANQESRLFFDIENIGEFSSWAIWLSVAKSKSLIKSLYAHTHISRSIDIGFESRGVARGLQCELWSLFPVSTVRFVLELDPLELVVYPEPYGISLTEHLSHNKGLIGEDGDFDGIKSFDGYANISKIHWASVAKGEIALKSFEKISDQEALVFDYSSCATTTELRLSQLTLWILECESTSRDFTVKMPYGVLDSKKQSIDEILKKFALH